MVLVGSPSSPLQAWSKLNRTFSVQIVDAVDAGHQAAQFAVVLGVKHVELDGSAMLNVKSHNTRLAVTETVPPDVVEGIERLAHDGHGVICRCVEPQLARVGVER